MSSTPTPLSAPEGPGSESGAPDLPAGFTAQDGPEDARIGEQHHSAGPQVEGEIDATDDRGRRWYRLRPAPRRRTDFMGFNSRWWMALGWLVLLVVVAFPFPWWW